MAQIPLTPIVEYYIRLGEFHHFYTDLEHELTCIIRNLVLHEIPYGKKFSIVSSVLGGQRMGASKDTIKRLVRAMGLIQTEREAIDKAFAQLGEIQFLRDRLAHHYTHQDEGHEGIWINDDYAGVKEFTKSRVIEFTPATLRMATADLIAIKDYLDLLFSQYLKSAAFAPKPFDVTAFPTWQYTPVAPTPRRP